MKHVPPIEIRMARLEEENERLRQKVATLSAKAELNPLRFPRSWRLRHQEALTLSLLLANDWVSTARLVGEIPRKAELDNDIALVRVVISTLRRKLAPDGIRIETLWGDGYRLSPGHKTRVESLIEDGARAQPEYRSSCGGCSLCPA